MDTLYRADGTVVQVPYLDFAAVLDVNAGSTIGPFPFDDPSLTTPINAYNQLKWFIRLMLIIVHRLGNMTIATCYLTEAVLQDMKDFTIVASTRLRDSMSDFEIKQELERIKQQCRLFSRTRWQSVLELDLGTWEFMETSFRSIAESTGRERAKMENMFLVGLKFYLMKAQTDEMFDNLENKIKHLPGYHTSQAAFREFMHYVRNPWKTLHWALSAQQYNIALIAAAYVDSRQIDCQLDGVSIRHLINELQDHECIPEAEFDELVRVINQPMLEQKKIKLDLAAIMGRYMYHLHSS